MPLSSQIDRRRFLQSAAGVAAASTLPRVASGRPPEGEDAPPSVMVLQPKFLEAIQDPKHEEHEEMLEWVGGKFDPEEFSAAAVNKDMRKWCKQECGVMSRRKLSPNAPCPCDSGKKYRHCCHNKGFDWVVGEDGSIGKSVPVSDELAEVVKQQHQKFVEEFGREPGPEDNLFFNMPHQEVVEHVMVEGMKQAGLDPAMIYAFEKTGLLVTEANEHLISDVDLEKWDEAITEYEMKQMDGESSGEEYF